MNVQQRWGLIVSASFFLVTGASAIGDAGVPVSQSMELSVRRWVEQLPAGQREKIRPEELTRLLLASRAHGTEQAARAAGESTITLLGLICGAPSLQQAAEQNDISRIVKNTELTPLQMLQQIAALMERRPRLAGAVSVMPITAVLGTLPAC